MPGPISGGSSGSSISGLSTGQHVRAASASTIETDGVKRYVALLTQTSTNAPVATVLENSLGGTLVWTRGSAGAYSGTLTGVFTADKTVGSSGVRLATGLGLLGTWHVVRASDNLVTLRSADLGGTLADDVLNGTAVEIRVYP